ncbi:carbamoyltransferase C-terminal domain-containing protein [Phytohabitans flavus]|uniref:Transferase n=1 Tax=Phytohabitans flavus TaxID=1076124 RepID=A0A6F8Y9A4_9ACTN|nr:carbamoyltransferase C-terminal domain-containing protein [Phytohabitans flavus]BCB82686.1 transferase [Phytohabitans flavus]
MGVVLGINENHDAAAAIMVDGQLVAAVAEERFTRRKHQSATVEHAVRSALSIAGVTLDDVDLLVTCAHRVEVHPDSPEAAFRRELIRSAPRWHEHDSHHDLHAYSAWFGSGFEEPAILVVDAVGTRLDLLARPLLAPGAEMFGKDPAGYECESIFGTAGGVLEPLAQHYTTHRPYDWSRENIGLGRLYNYAAKEIFGTSYAAGKLMALAALAEASPGTFVDLDAPWPRPRHDAFSAFSGPKVHPEPEALASLAAGVQKDLECTMLALARRAAMLVDSRQFCVAGGVGLNCPANSRMLRDSGFADLYVFPAATDDGVAVGAAVAGSWCVLGEKDRPKGRLSPFLGAAYSDEEVRHAIGRMAVDLDAHGVTSQEFESTDALLDEICDDLRQDRVVSWFTGRSEFGPRALGNRSLLASPRSARMRERINRDIKGRERFRPLAPVMPESLVEAYFEVPPGFRSPEMLLAPLGTAQARALAPAAFHVDGSARVQTLSDTSSLGRLCLRFLAATGCPMLLNTSLNGPGDPIVEAPDDAIALFLRRPIDVLVFNESTVLRREAR